MIIVMKYSCNYVAKSSKGKCWIIPLLFFYFYCDNQYQHIHQHIIDCINVVVGGGCLSRNLRLLLRWASARAFAVSGGEEAVAPSAARGSLSRPPTRLHHPRCWFLILRLLPRI